jgi:hypothetical protein
MGAILVLNQPRFMTLMWALVRPFMSAKMKQRVHLLGKDVGAITAEMDAALLPPCVHACVLLRRACMLACMRALRMRVCVCACVWTCVFQ